MTFLRVLTLLILTFTLTSLASAETSAKAGATSASTGKTMYQSSVSEVWTEYDRLRGALVQGTRRMIAGGVGSAGIGAFFGLFGGPAAPVTVLGSALAGAVIGGTSGAFFGMVEGYRNPLSGRIKPTGQRVTDKVTTTINEITGFTTIVKSSTTEDLSTGEVNTWITSYNVPNKGNAKNAEQKGRFNE